MTLDGEVTLLDSFAHTKYDRKKILDFDFIKGCSLLTGGSYPGALQTNPGSLTE